MAEVPYYAIKDIPTKRAIQALINEIAGLRKLVAASGGRVVVQEGGGGGGGGYELPVAGPNRLGGVKVGANLSITAGGVLNAAGATPYVLPVASADTLGGVKVGSGLAITNGVLSVTGGGGGGSARGYPFIVIPDISGAITLLDLTNNVTVATGATTFAVTFSVGTTGYMRDFYWTIDTSASASACIITWPENTRGPTSARAGRITVIHVSEYESSHFTATVVYERSITPAWGDFDLALTTFNSGAQRTDSTATYQSSRPVHADNIQCLPDNSICFGAPDQGHAYVWGFGTGYEFDMAQMNSMFTSRATAVASFKTAVISCEGTYLYDATSSNAIYKAPIGTAYDLSTRGTRSSNITTSVNPRAVFFGDDDRLLFYKNMSSAALYKKTLSSGVETSVNLSNFYAGAAASLTWNGFTFSPDGSILIATAKDRVVKFTLSEPWDIDTLTYHSEFVATNDANANLTGVAINTIGTKMILFDNGSSSSAIYRQFLGYDLATSQGS